MTNKNQKIIEPIDAPNTDPMDAADEFELQRMKLLNDLAVAHVIIPGTAFKPANRHSSSTDFFISINLMVLLAVLLRAVRQL